jgi:tol-pal system protein YbgF
MNRRGARPLAAIAALSLLTAGCLTASQQSRLQTDLEQIRTQAFANQREMAALQSKIQALEQTIAKQATATPTKYADLESLVTGLKDEVRTLGARLDDSNTRMNALSRDIAAAREQYRTLEARLAALQGSGPPPAAQPLGGRQSSYPGSSYPGAPGSTTPGGSATAGSTNPSPSPSGSGRDGGTDTAAVPSPSTYNSSPGGSGSGPAPSTSSPTGPPSPSGSPASAGPAGSGGGGQAPVVPAPSTTGQAARGSVNPGAWGINDNSPATEADQEEAFRAAYQDFTRGDYDRALTGFQEFQRRFPKSPLTANSDYFMGECLFSQQRHQEAVEAFTRAIAEKPDGDRVAAAYLKKGLSLLALKQTAQGVIQLQHVIESYPRTEEARIATERLRSLGLRDH